MANIIQLHFLRWIIQFSKYMCFYLIFLQIGEVWTLGSAYGRAHISYQQLLIDYHLLNTVLWASVTRMLNNMLYSYLCDDYNHWSSVTKVIKILGLSRRISYFIPHHHLSYYNENWFYYKLYSLLNTQFPSMNNNYICLQHYKDEYFMVLFPMCSQSSGKYRHGNDKLHNKFRLPCIWHTSINKIYWQHKQRTLVLH